jgi:hypothetical protein
LVKAANEKPALAGFFHGAPSMGAHLRVQVLLRAGHIEQSEAQLREGERAREGSVEHKSRADEQEPHFIPTAGKISSRSVNLGWGGVGWGGVGCASCSSRVPQW